jgi:hypothetical protein
MTRQLAPHRPRFTPATIVAINPVVGREVGNLERL